ncbi:MAG: hypothetical protein COA42_22090 [Alteromonadaceae bacterium]|nr:hypothetical protein [Colwellia sp.]PCK02556.1 MAG: hypothetical protein COA42_22090 [Alteromonadaceae bacterium]
MNIEFSPKAFFKINLYLIGLLLCANILGIVSKYYFDHDHVYGLVGMFNFDTEKNIPTLYSSIALLFSSMLLSIIAFQSKKLDLSYIPWFGLSFIFMFLSVDEISSIHERFTGPVKETLGVSGFLYYAWVIPYGLALVVFIMAYSKFLFKLPRRTMIMFLISGATFVSGAVGLELLGGRQTDLYGMENITYATITTCEELLEMLGIAIFIYTLLTYMDNQFEGVVITITKSEQIK